MDDQILRRIDPKTRMQDGPPVPLEGTPTGVAVDPRSGEVWVANGLLGSVSQVDAQYNDLVKTINVTSRSSSGAVDVGGGAVWAVFGNSTLARLPSQGKITKGYAGGEPTGIVYAEGAIWVTNGGDSTYSRFDPKTFETGALVTTERRLSPERDRVRGGVDLDRNGRRRNRLADRSFIVRHRRSDSRRETPECDHGRRGCCVGGKQRRRHRLEDRSEDEHGCEDDSHRQCPGRPRGGRRLRLGDRAVALAAYSRQTAARSSCGRRTMHPTRFETSVISLMNLYATIGAASRAIRRSSFA